MLFVVLVNGTNSKEKRKNCKAKCEGNESKEKRQVLSECKFKKLRRIERLNSLKGYTELKEEWHEEVFEMFKVKLWRWFHRCRRHKETVFLEKNPILSNPVWLLGYWYCTI